MSIITYDQLDDPTGVATTGVGQLAKAARNGACNLYHKYPGWFLGAQWSPTRQVQEFFWERICYTDDGTYSSPSIGSGTPGGQCDYDYKVLVAHKVTSAPGVPNGYTQQAEITAHGKIRGLIRVVDGNNYRWFVIGGKNTDYTQIEYYPAYAYNPYGLQGDEVYIVSVTPANGGTDDCGDVPENFPIIQPPVEEVNYNTQVTINNRVVNIPVTIPIVNFDPTLQFEPQFNIDVGGINFTLKSDGIEYKPSDGIQLPTTTPVGDYPTGVNPPQTDADPISTGNNNGGDCPDVDLKPIEDILTDIQTDIDSLLDCDRCNDDSGYVYQSQTLGEGQSGLYAIDDACVYVVVTLTTIPRNSKQQAGVTAPDVIYAGWCEYRINGKALPRHPIHFEQGSFTKPELATEFAMTLPKGYAGRIDQVLKLKQE